MPSLTQRRQARARLDAAYQDALSEVIPPDEAVPLRGKTFIEFEDQVYEAGRKVMTVAMEERARLDAAAWQEQPGCCPHCGSDRVYLEKEQTLREFLSPVGPLHVRLQNCRCRACDGSFSPSASRLAAAQ
jgi:hypothetical protein